MDNAKKIVRYIKSGCKEKNDFKYGVELEHFVLDKDLKAVSYENLRNILKGTMDENDILYEKDGYFMGYYNDDYSISFEPSAQLEISISPRCDLNEIKDIYMSFRKKLNEKMQEYSFKVVNYGYNPSCMADELDIIPKKRYVYMNDYFKSTGTMGKNMMRATAATQVSIDYENEKDAVKKYQLACILSPILSFITDNCVFYEGKLNDKNLTRTYIWNNVDNKRCGILKGCMKEDFSFEKYAQYLLNTPAIVIDDRFVTKTFKTYFGEQEMSYEQIEHALSMLFLDVRIKQYIEIRMADSMPIQYVIAYTALIKGIFSNAEKFMKYFGKITENDINKAKFNLIKDGYEAIVYGKNVRSIVDMIFIMLRDGLTIEEQKLLSPLKSLVDKRITLKDMEIERVEIMCNSFKMKGKLI